MNYDQIRVKPTMVSYRVYRSLAQYGVWYSAESKELKCKKSVVNHFKNPIEAVVMKEMHLPQITLSLFD